MFHSSKNALVRVAVFPVCLLFWQYVFGTDLPLLAPAMCAVFLTTTHDPPPFIMVVLMGGVLFATTWFQALLANLLDDYPQVYYLALLGVFYWCMDRTRKNPQDLLAILLIVATVMIAVFTRQMGSDVSQIPVALLKNIFIAGFVAYLAYFLFPGGEPLAPAPPQLGGKPLTEGRIKTLFKASIVLSVLAITISMDLAQSTIITVVVALVIKDPNPVVGHDYGVRRLLTTYASVLYAIPPLLMSLLGANLVGVFGAAVVSALFMGIHAAEKKASYNSIQLLYASYVVLVYYGLTSTGISAVYDDLIRFASIMFASVIGVMALILLQPADETR